MWSHPCNRPWRPIGLWDVEAPTFSRQSAHRWRWGCQPDAPAGRPLPPGRFLVLISVSGWIDPRATVRLEELDQLWNPMISLGIKPKTFGLVVECLNQINVLLLMVWTLYLFTCVQKYNYFMADSWCGRRVGTYDNVVHGGIKLDSPAAGYVGGNMATGNSSLTEKKPHWKHPDWEHPTVNQNAAKCLPPSLGAHRGGQLVGEYLSLDPQIGSPGNRLLENCAELALDVLPRAVMHPSQLNRKPRELQVGTAWPGSARVQFGRRPIKMTP
jgi:hypothetical protein